MTTTTPTDGIAAAIRAEMGRQRITMVALARKTGIPRSTLAAQINGEAKLRADVAVAVARALRVSLRKLAAA